MSVSSSKSRRVSPKRRKRSRRHSPEEARREIMDSAVRFLWEHNFRDLTIGELMGDTPLSRPAFYQYFTDLHELIESLLSEVGAVMHQTAHPWINGEGEPIAALWESQKGVVQTCVDHGPIFRAVAEAAPLDERLERTWSAFTGALGRLGRGPYQSSTAGRPNFQVASCATNCQCPEFTRHGLADCRIWSSASRRSKGRARNVTPHLGFDFVWRTSAKTAKY